jgi:hypothetical protein
VSIEMTNAQLHGCEFKGWQCFHCGEIFTTVGGASDHFGASPDKEPGCLIKIKVGDERGLLMELRKAESERDSLQHDICNESTEADLVMQRMQAQHLTELRREEEIGYGRGLKDYTNLESQRDELLAALKYHQEQTRPIQRTIDIIAKCEKPTL